MINENEKKCAFSIQNWQIARGGSDGYTAPECIPQVLQGLIDENHPKWRPGPHGKRMFAITSTIVEVDGRFVRTLTGSVYRLGRVRPTMRKKIRESGLEYDRCHPLGNICTEALLEEEK